MENQPLDHSPEDPESDSPESGFFFDKPSLVLRIKSMLIDAVAVIALMMLMAWVLNGLEVGSGTVRGLCFLGVLLYEPVLVAFNRTIGQAVVGLQVRRLSDLKNGVQLRPISIFASLARYVVKGLLGWISLLTIHSDRYGQAIHDKVASSVMVIAEQ